MAVRIINTLDLLAKFNPEILSTEERREHPALLHHLSLAQWILERLEARKSPHLPTTPIPTMYHGDSFDLQRFYY